MKIYYWFFGFLILVAAGAIALNVTVRQGAVIDARIAADFEQIRNLVENEVSRTGALPSGFQELPLDPEMKARTRGYTYVQGPHDNYQLCARFRTDTLKAMEYAPDYVNFRRRPEGDYCFPLLSGQASKIR